MRMEKLTDYWPEHLSTTAVAMTITTHRTARFSAARRLHTGGWLLLLLAACFTSSRTEAKEAAMNHAPLTLWQTIEQLVQQVPFTPEKVQQTVGTPLKIEEQDEFSKSWTGGEISLRDNIRVTRTGLTLGPNGEFTDFSALALFMSGACITRDQVEEHYRPLRLIEAPRGRSLEESAVWAIAQPWGELRFAFKERNPDCLYSVVLAAPEESSSSLPSP